MSNRVSFDAGSEPEHVYNRFCQHLELVLAETTRKQSSVITGSSTDREYIKAVMDIIQNCPLILFSKDKAKRAIGYIRGLKPGERKLVLPFRNMVITDPLGTVAIIDAKPISEVRDTLDDVGRERLDLIMKDAREDCDPISFSAIIHLMDVNTQNAEITDTLDFALCIAWIRKDLAKSHGGEVIRGVGNFLVKDRNSKNKWNVIGPRNIKEYDATTQQMVANDILHSVFTSLEELVYMVQPQIKTVVKEPKKKRKKHKKLPRTHDRCTMIMLDPEEFRAIYSGSRRPNSTEKRVFLGRMGHWRTFHHERYGDKVGKSIWINEIIVKDGEIFISKNRIYKVVDMKRRTEGKINGEET